MSARDDKLAAALVEWLKIEVRPSHPLFPVLAAEFRAILARHGLAVLPVNKRDDFGAAVAAEMLAAAKEAARHD